MKASEQKTNVMRLLEQKKVSYTPHEYPHGDEAVDGVTVAETLGQPVEKVFKTLVARGASKKIYVFDIPVAEELDLKKAARAVGEKSVALIHVKEITELTGYVRGGCSPIGMKKQYPTVFHASCDSLDTIMVSAGKIGYQIELDPKELIRLTRATTADIIITEEK